ncbi:uncharacterized protein [Euphorbia lathyris]|uniref:uncharacterized protein n=1 Tax=Euphorbia lathyris TaxID=212925 RepID=UPI003313A009
MDCILSFLGNLITDPIKQYIVTPTARHIGYAFKCNSKVQTLQGQVEQLKNKKDRLQHSVDHATRNREEIFENVTNWLSSAGSAIGDAEQLVQQKEEAKKKCLLGLCPNLKTRYQLSKKADKKASGIEKLLNEKELDPVSFPLPPKPILEPSVYSREALPSRVLILNQIMDALRDPTLNMLGVYGMGGIGKTTLAKEVQGKALAEALFETVVVVTVSQTPELRRIQAEISDFLGLKFDVEELPGRASRLRNRLENSKVLVILDDLWQKLDLNAIGIPYGDASKGCKIILTSRNMDLLSSEMRAQKLFSLEALKEEETWKLFEMSVAEAKDAKFHAIATKIAKKCAGLPLLIQLVATDLQNKDSYEWNDKLSQLSTFGDEEIYGRVYKVLESSFESLPGEEMKSFFLLCALFGQSNIRIQYLLIHSMGLGLFKHIRTIEGGRDKVLTLINKLKAKSLLLDGDMVGFVKMHDVVRDTALSIASRVQHAFIGIGEVRLRDWPNQDCTRISLPYSDARELPVDLNCPEAELFLLFTEDLCLKVPHSFFERIQNLKVVHFSGMRLVPLPSSIGSLAKLQALCLHKCRLDNVATIGKMKQLELLSFADSDIVELPKEIEALTQLKQLDLRNCSNLQVIPENVLSKLSSLEELYMLNSFVRWNANGNARLVELESLPNLSTLEIQIVNSKSIPQGCRFFDGLRSYKISIGDRWGNWEGNDERSRKLKLKLDAGIHLEDGIEVLLRGIQDLSLSEAMGIESLLYDLDREGFPQLKHLRIEYDSSIQHLIKSTMQPYCHAFPILESLYLRRLMCLEKMCHGQLEMGCFGELRILKMERCDKLKSLFSFSSAKCLLQLREIDVAFCENLEAIVCEGSEGEDCINEVIEFNQLSSLKLEKLPKLTGFCKIKEGTAPMELLFNELVSFPNLTSLEVWECKCLKYVFTAPMLKRLSQLKMFDLMGCESVEEIIQSKKDEEIESINMILFPKLDSLRLKELPKLQKFGCGYSIEFPLLRELRIRTCNAMKNFVSRFSSNESEEEYFFNEMVTFSNLETMQIYGMNFKYLWSSDPCGAFTFENLLWVHVTWCRNLKYVFPASIACKDFKLQKLEIDNCKSLEVIIAKEKDEGSEGSPCFAFRQLSFLQLINLEKMRSLYEGPHNSEWPNLKRLEVYGCHQIMKFWSKISSCHQENEEGNGLVPFQQTLFSLDKFIPNLEELTIDDQSLRAIHQSGDFSVELFSRLKNVTLHSSQEESIPFLFGFLRRLCSLERLVFNGCSLHEIAIGEEEHHPRLKHLNLRYVDNLRHMMKKSSLLNPILQYLQTLDVYSCHDLINIAPSSVSFQNLITLNVSCCSKMTNLVKASTAKTMVQLMELGVFKCEGMEEIIATDADCKEHDDIIFNKLKRLNLDGLDRLNSFCSGNYDFSFPLLEEVNVKGCSIMEFFCGGELSTPKLRGVQCEDEQQWEGNLNATIACQLKKWVGGHFEEGRVFQNLESLKVVKNAICSKAILANQLHFLNRLTEITVSDCESVQVVFDLEELSAEGRSVGLLSQLNEIQLTNLPMLSQLCNKGPRGILDFSKLQVLKIDNCSRLEYAFTWSMASCLFQLQMIEVKNCEMMETIIKEEEAEDVTQVILDSLQYINVECLPKFSSIYSGSGDLECPSLEVISIRNCLNIKSFISRLTKEDREGKENHNLICCSHKEFPKLEQLSLDIKSITAILQFELPMDFFSNVKSLLLRYYSATTKSHVGLLHFLSRLPNGVELAFFNSSVEELFKFEGLISTTLEGAATTLPQIRALTLINLDHLKQIWWQNSQLQYLETLKVISCGNLINLASSSTSFQNLTTLKAYGCNQLRNLISSSVAKTLVQLERLTVESCKMLMVIVEDRNDETEEIVFTKMKKMELIDLQSLRSFSLGNSTFEFPCLEQIVLSYCPNMRVFCPRSMGNISTPMLNSVIDDPWSKELYWEGNLNETIEQIYKKMVGFKDEEDVKLSTFPTLKDKWGGQFAFENFVWLERLVVDECPMISNAISSHILQHLKKLKVLIVEKCDLVEQVFDLEGLNATEFRIDERMENLNELHLVDLPKLTHVWSKDPQQILSFENLQLLKVHNCGNLTFIFNLSMALTLPNLQRVEVKNCSLVEHIIAKAEEEKMQEYQTIFPSLESMNLQYLTKLSGFYSASGFLECPSLKMIEVVECPNMELFLQQFQTDKNQLAMRSCFWAIRLQFQD